MTDLPSEDLILKEPVKGSVKWFSTDKGYGFIVPDAGGPDVLIHANTLRNYGRNSIAEGTKIEVSIALTNRGVQVVEVLDIEPPSSNLNSLEDFSDIDPEEIANTPFEPARVKWFDKIKGYGFANPFLEDSDVFLHVEIVKRSGLGLLEPGEAIAIKVIEGKRGLIAVEICSWLQVQEDEASS